MQVMVLHRDERKPKRDIQRISVTTEAGTEIWVTETEQGDLYISDRSGKVHGINIKPKGD